VTGVQTCALPIWSHLDTPDHHDYLTSDARRQQKHEFWLSHVDRDPAATEQRQNTHQERTLAGTTVFRGASQLCLSHGIMEPWRGLLPWDADDELSKENGT
jgi:hypothetical protein